MSNKANNEERQFHNSILDGDDLALSKLFGSYGNSVIKKIKSRYPNVTKKDEALILEAVNEAFFGFFKNPATYDPDKTGLHRFLEVAAERDLINLLSKDKKIPKRKNLPEDVELQERFWNSIKKEDDSTDWQIIQQESMEAIETELTKYFQDDLDIELAKLIMVGERKTSVFVKILRIDSLTEGEQEREVKRHKDRIKKVIDRNQVDLKLKKIINE